MESAETMVDAWLIQSRHAGNSKLNNSGMVLRKASIGRMQNAIIHSPVQRFQQDTETISGDVPSGSAMLVELKVLFT